MAVSPDTVFAGAKNRCVPSKAQHGLEYTVSKGGLPMSELHISHSDSPFLEVLFSWCPLQSTLNSLAKPWLSKHLLSCENARATGVSFQSLDFYKWMSRLLVRAVAAVNLSQFCLMSLKETTHTGLWFHVWAVFNVCTQSLLSTSAICLCWHAQTRRLQVKPEHASSDLLIIYITLT